MSSETSTYPKALTPRLRFPEFKAHWHQVPLGKLAKPISDRVGAAECVPYTVTSGVGLVSQNEKFGRTIAGNSLGSYIRLLRDDFAYNKSSTKSFPEGYVARLTVEVSAAVPKSIFTCFRPDSSKIEPSYLDYLFANNLHGKWLRKFLSVGARAHGSLNVNDEDLWALPVPMPSGPLSGAEQMKIAECLTSLDGFIAAEARRLEALRAHKKALMQNLFPREGESRPRLRFPEFRESAEWQETALERVIEIASGQVDPREPPYSGLPSIGGENIESHTGKLSGVRTAREIGVISGKYAFGPEDILYSKIRPALNKVAMPEFEGICSADIYPIRPSTTELRRSYLFLILQSEAFLRYATKHSARGKIPKINREALMAYRVLIPSAEEQQRIADCLSSLDVLIAAISQHYDTFRNHKKGLMQQLFPSPN
ncbi:MAG TPA: restriction endonuclease subunit S [Fimbriimonas sp.]|nr:restriction endonuclease subunit S [Fimbriimonas sp.]